MGGDWTEYKKEHHLLRVEISTLLVTVFGLESTTFQSVSVLSTAPKSVHHVNHTAVDGVMTMHIWVIQTLFYSFYL